MNVYEKLAEARAELKGKNLKMSGKNTYAGYDYFDLKDLLPHITEIERKNKLLSVVRYSADIATLTVYNTENPEEKIEFSSPMSTAELKGCHAVQNLGAVETYVRRYLYLAAYEIVEAEQLDLMQGKPDRAPKTPYEGGNGNKWINVNEAIKGTSLSLKTVDEWILKKFGQAVKINDLSDEQYGLLMESIKKAKENAKE